MLNDLLKQIEDHLAWRSAQGRPMAETTFGMKAVRDSKLLARLAAGRSISVTTLDRIKAWIEADRVAVAARLEQQDAA